MKIMLIYFYTIKNLIYKGDYICLKMAADVLGLSDVGSVITPKETMIRSMPMIM